MKNKFISSKLVKSFLYLIAVILTSNALYGQTNTDSAFKWSVDKTKNNICIQVKIPQNFYLYKKYTNVELKNSQNREIAPATKPKPVNYKDDFGSEQLIYPSGIWKWNYKTSPGHDYDVKVKYQGCSKKPLACYPPEIFIKKIKSENTSQESQLTEQKNAILSPISDKKVSSNISTTDTESSSYLQLLMKKGGIWFFLVAFIGGLFSVFTPCVLPLIPITLAVLGAGKEVSRSQACRRSFLYVLGIIVTYTGLAVFAALTGKAFGSTVLSNPIILGLFAVFFIVMAFSLLGLYDFQLPSSLNLKLNNVGGNSNIGALFMGLVAGFIAIPCTGPVLATLLGIAAAGGNIIFGITLLATYAVGFGIPFFIIGIGLVKAPKSGGYMNLIKSLLGIIILVLAFYILSIVLPQLNLLLMQTSLTFKITAVAFIILGVLTGAFHGDGHSTNKFIKLGKTFGAILVAIGIIWILKQSTSISQTGNLSWDTNITKVFANSKTENKPVILDFTAEWCVACKELESVTFSNTKVEEKLDKHWLLAKVDVTRDSAETQKLIEKYNIKGFPTVIFFSPTGKELYRFSGFKNADDFLKIVNKYR